MKYWFLFIALILSFPAYALDTSGFEKFDFSSWNYNTKMVDVNNVYIDYMQFKDAQEPFLGFITPTTRLDLHLDVNFLNDIVFINNMVHSETDASQYRVIGWNYRMGVHLGNYIDIYMEHYSQHVLDMPEMFGPNIYDAVGVRFYLYRGNK